MRPSWEGPRQRWRHGARRPPARHGTIPSVSQVTRTMTEWVTPRPSKNVVERSNWPGTPDQPGSVSGAVAAPARGLPMSIMTTAPRPRPRTVTPADAQRGGRDGQGDGGAVGPVRAAQRAEPERRDRRRGQATGDREDERSGEPAGGAADQSGQERGEQAAHYQGKGSGCQAGAARVVGRQGDEVTDHRTAARCLGLAQPDRDGLQGLSDRGGRPGDGDRHILY